MINAVVKGEKTTGYDMCINKDMAKDNSIILSNCKEMIDPNEIPN
jgi:hypothetical protein